MTPSLDAAELLIREGDEWPIPAQWAALPAHRLVFRHIDTPPLSGGPYRRICGLGIVRYADPLVLLERLYQALTPGGELILVDRFRPTAADTDLPWEGYHPIPQLQALAEKIGFTVATLPPLAPSPAPVTVQLTLVRNPQPPRWRVGFAAPENLPALADLFQRVFGGEMSAELWHWKYGSGRGQSAVAWAEGRLVAHYGGITRPIRYFGRAEQACQVADVMVEQTERGVLTRKGAFFLTGSSLPEACSGWGAKHIIGFGFPNLRHLTLAARIGLYQEVGRILELAWTPRGPAELTAGLRATEITPGHWPRYRARVEALWQRMAGAFQQGIIGVRDAAWFEYRYLRHPHHHYRLYWVTRGLLRRPVGLFVLRPLEGRCELMDLAGVPDAFPGLVALARVEAGRLGAAELFAWVSRAHLPHFQQPEHDVRDPDVVIPTSVWTPAPPAEQLAERWFLMAGDTDFL